MRHRVSTLLIVLAAPAALAQGADLNETQLRGRQVFAQSCGICHLQPSLGVRTYGPPLNKAATAGSQMGVLSLRSEAELAALKAKAH